MPGITRANKLGTNNGGNTLSSLQLTLTVATTAGNAILVALTWGANNPTCTVTDDAGNVYQEDRAQAQAGGSNAFGRIFSSNSGQSLGIGQKITVTWTGNTVNGPVMAAYEYANFAKTNWLDQVNSGTSVGSNTPNTGSVSTLAANELVFGMFGWQPGTSAFSLPSATELDKFQPSRAIETQELIVAATGNYSMSGTLVTTPTWVGLIASYRAAVSPTDVLQVQAPPATRFF